MPPASRLRHPALALFFGAALAASAIATPAASLHAQRAGAPRTIADTLRIYYVGYPVGYERYEIAGGAGGVTLTTELDYTDRARRTHVKATLRMAPDWTPGQLEITRLTDTSSRVETRIDVRGREAMVFARGDSTRVALPGAAFAIAGTTPTAQHLALVRYWLAHGRPATLAVIPGGPVNAVTVEARGRDTLAAGGRRMVLDRYAVDGLVWGRETVWLDGEGRLAGFITAGGGGLTLSAVRQALDSLRPRLVASATRDRLADLARLSRSVPVVAAARGAGATVALAGATLVDGTGRDAIPDAVVVVRGGRIVAAGARASVAIPSGARTVDVRGKTIAPGLWDMHAHLMQVEWAPVYLAAGVTTARDMGNEVDFIVPFRRAVDSVGSLGPRMLLAGLIDGGGPNAFGAVNAETPEEGRAAVRMYHALGFEQMKLYTLLKPDVVGAITAEAHELGMTVTGHVPRALTLLAAVDSGMDQIAHLPIQGNPASDSLRSLIDSLKAHGTVIDPTASWGELLQHSTAEPVAAFQPGVAYLPPILAQRITRMGAANLDTATAHARLGRTLAVLRALHAAGVPVVAGTDEGVPGFSVYREIELYARAGFTPAEAMQAASGTSARVMGLERDVGTLEPGKRADLIVLDANPLEAIANIRTVRMVMTRGVLYRSADIWKAAGFGVPRQ
ncbi:MAG: amidohydrolase family protein [Gemmatimonadaceae bacterium]